MTSAEEWLLNEDKQCRNERLTRLKWIAAEYPDVDIVIFHGGMKSQFLFEEARYCYVYAQYVATTLLSLAFIEDTLASVLYASGDNGIHKAGIFDLLEKAKNDGLISDSEFDLFDKVRKIRNPISHFRKPSHKKNIEYRCVENDSHPYELLESDAQTALKATFRLIAKFSISQV
ncbi:MAG: hypothetical protein Q8J62_10660 [Candidatus Cloacimonadaceae bacterium]|nr:hypothetical protein [Candidatus Cloacimonadaceae bacterium]